MRITIIGYYDADDEHYGEDGGDPIAMAAIDQANVDDDPTIAFDMIDNAEMTMTVEPA